MLRNHRITNPAKTYILSDPHFNHNHPEILRMAGVKTREELNEKRVADWNAAVPEDADVAMLGDFCLHDPDGSLTRQLLKKLHGKNKYMLWGNHNSGVKKLYREKLAQQFFKDREAMANNYEVYPLRFSIGQDNQVIFVGEKLNMLWRPEGARSDIKIICQHYAERNWLQKQKGTWMLCGHSHGNDRGIAELGDTGLGKILEVSFDAIGRPRNILEIAEIMNGKPAHRGEVAPGEDEDDQA